MAPPTLIDPTVANARRILAGLARLGFGFAGELSPEEVARRPVTVVGDMPNVDVLTRAWNLSFSHARKKAVDFDLK